MENNCIDYDPNNPKDCWIKPPKLYYCPQCQKGGICSECLLENHTGHFIGKAPTVEIELKKKEVLLNQIFNDTNKKSNSVNVQLEDLQNNFGKELETFRKQLIEKKSTLNSFMEKCRQLNNDFEKEGTILENEISNFLLVEKSSMLKENNLSEAESNLIFYKTLFIYNFRKKEIRRRIRKEKYKGKIHLFEFL